MNRSWAAVVMILSLLLVIQGVAAAPEDFQGPEIENRRIMVNRRPGFSVRVWVDRDPGKSGQAVYRVGQQLTVFVQTSQPAYVYVFNVRANGLITPVAPNRYERQVLVQPGVVRPFHAPGGAYSFTVAPPPGDDRIFAIATRTPVSLARILDVDQGRVSVTGAGNLGRALSGVVKPLPQPDWVTDVAWYRVTTGPTR